MPPDECRSAPNLEAQVQLFLNARPSQARNAPVQQTRRSLQKLTLLLEIA
jgi:hypothetical protein